MRSLACVLLCLLSSSAFAAELVALTPMMAGDRPVMRAGPKGEPQAPILKRTNDAIAKAIAVEAARGALPFMLALDEEAQRLAGAQKPGPTYLLRSIEEGGFARRGFWLAESGNNVVWHADPYVDLVVDQQSIEEGSFEEIFSHELGHVLLRRLLPKLPNGLSRTPHSSLALTDYPTAFDEGFAIHFQGLARKLTKNAKLEALDRGLEYKPFLHLWQSNIDRSLRLRGMRENLFVHTQLSVPLQVGDASALFDLSHFKNGQQMLSSEGVIATLFYHLMLRAQEPQTALLERYKALLTTLRNVNTERLTSATPVLLNVVQTHIQRVPAAKEEWLTTLLNLTYGATTSTAVTRDLPKLSALGQEGRQAEYMAALRQSRSALKSLTDQVIRNPQRLAAALGPEIWLAFKNEAGIVTMNLNTAEKASYMQVLGFDSLDADLTLADRVARGPFASVEDFAARRKSAPLLRKRLIEAQTLAIKTGGFQRE